MADLNTAELYYEQQNQIKILSSSLEGKTTQFLNIIKTKVMLKSLDSKNLLQNGNGPISWIMCVSVLVFMYTYICYLY